MEIIVRASLVYLFLWVVMRAIGKRDLAEMNPLDMVLLVVIGDLVQQAVTAEDTSLVGAALAVGTMALWVLVFSYTSWRWPRSRKLIEGLPVVVVRDGRLVEEALSIERLPSDEVYQAARQQGIDDLAQVRIALLEPGGTISFIRVQG